MYSIIQQGDSVENYVLELVCDTSEELVTLPKECAVGSTCIVIADSSVWMLGHDKVWHEI